MNHFIIPYFGNKRKEYKLFKNNIDFLNKKYIEINENRIIVNPILDATHIPSFIPAMDIWVELNNYISSKYNDKTIEIKNSDTDKLINHGFDKVSSFRNPIK